MHNIPGSECASALVAAGLADLPIIRALVAEIGLTREEAALATALARSTTPVHNADAEIERARRHGAASARWDATARSEVMA